MIGTILRRGAGSMRFTSRVPSPTAAAGTARRFTFAFTDSIRRAMQEQRRRAVADYIDGWADAVIVAERLERSAMQCHVTFTTRRAMPVRIVEQFIADCSHVVRGTVEAVGA